MSFLLHFSIYRLILFTAGIIGNTSAGMVMCRKAFRFSAVSTYLLYLSVIDTFFIFTICLEEVVKQLKQGTSSVMTSS